ncbi:MULTISPECIES: DUF1456 family protein [unclassified Fusibacter]|uniref:DUF1456 family protein n=1 Tax=unclassified Fusibacter TaxID=2624464 RepID=UPI0013E99B2A|nr:MULTISPECIES: DUF1456 family protein [unclassified Fusibacter]MCK8060360.1 DUF1456 family protein [Fusibacter sp. A2]NPE20351.1 DUF1456 family protein [Fusibacter sp. A1]
MKNNELLTKICRAADVDIKSMVTIFAHSDFDFTEEDAAMMLVDFDSDEEQDLYPCDFEMLEAFLNGLIIFKRGPRPDDGKPKKTVLSIPSAQTANNAVLKKMKIAFAMTGDDLVEVFENAGVTLTNRELNPYFRAEGHKHYKRCNDQFLNAFFAGLTTKNKNA